MSDSRTSFWACCGFAVLTTILAGSEGSNAGPIQVIYSKLSGHPTSTVPGALDLNGNPAVTEFRALELLVGSPDGSRWMLTARTQQGSDLETCILVGSGMSGSIFAQEGQPVHGGVAGEIYDFFGSGLGRFDDNNNFAYSARARGGVASVFQKVIRVVNGNATIVEQMGDLLTGLSDLAPNPSGDELFGNSVGSIHLLNNGVVGSQDSTITNIHSSRRPAIFYNKTAFHQTNVTTVTGLGGIGSFFWNSIDANKFYTTPDGLHWVAQGTVGTDTSTNVVLVHDGQIVIRKASPVSASGPGSSVIANNVFNTALLSDGTWLARGDIANGDDWAVRNGALVAKTGDPIIPGSTELWGNTFSVFTGNRNGDWVIFGNTTNSPAGTASDDVIVLNGTRVLVREGDPVDLNNNGIADDDAYIGRGTNTLTAFSGNNAFLTDAGVLYFFANLRNAAGQDLNSNPAFSTPLAFLRIDVNLPCIADLTADHVVNIDDLLFVINHWGNAGGPADITHDNIVNIDDLLAVINAWGACP